MTIFTTRRGFVIILVVAFLAIILLVAGVIINIGCSEILQTRTRNDLISAYYVASAGAENMYTKLKSIGTVIWPQSLPQTPVLQSALEMGSFTVNANIISNTKFCIASEGVFNGRKTKAIVKYGYISDFTGGVPLCSISQMILRGATNPAKLKIEGPAVSNSTIQTNGFVQVTNSPLQNQHLLEPTFWCDAYGNYKEKFDTNNDGLQNGYLEDVDQDGVITMADLPPEGDPQRAAKLALFVADDAYPPPHDATPAGDGIVDDKDAFFYYYTVDLNNRYNLGIGPGEPNYYSGDKNLAPGDIATNVAVIFVDGNVAVNNNDQDWHGNVTLKHTLAATGNMSIVQPTNRAGDVLTIISYGNVYTTGEMGSQGGVGGDLVIYANGNFVAENGGKANASIFAKGTATIDTIGDDQGKDHRMLNKSTINWSDPNNRPIGLPKDYAILSLDFTISNESTHKSIWQRN